MPNAVRVGLRWVPSFMVTASARQLPRGLLAVVALATALPLLLVRYLPFTDLPEHVAAIATMARLLPGGGGAPAYAISWGSQYLLYDLAGAIVTRIIGDAVLANRLLLAAVAIAWPYALRSLVRALDRDERVAILAPATFWNRALTIGFLPFVASVPLALFALSALLRQLAKPSRKGALVLGALGLVLFYTHVSSFLVFAFAGGVMTLVRAGRDPKRIVTTAAPLVPAGIAAVVWWLGGSLAGEKNASSRLPGGTAFEAVPLWAFDVWRTHADEVCATVWWCAFALFAASGLKRKSTTDDLKRGAFALAPLACALAVYALTPFHVGPAGYLDVRLAPMIALLMIPILRPSEESGGGSRVRQRTLAPIVLASLAALGNAATATVEMTRVQHEMLGDFDGLLAKMKPNTKLALLNFDQRSPRFYFWPYVFAGSYHRLAPGAVAAYSFTGMEHWPLHYTPGSEPPPHPGLWVYRPCEFEYRHDGAYYDYVLVQGKLSPWDEGHPGPPFQEIARSGAFILFEKTSNDDPLPDIPDRGPCAPWIGPPGPRPSVNEGVLQRAGVKARRETKRAGVEARKRRQRRRRRRCRGGGRGAAVGVRDRVRRGLAGRDRDWRRAERCDGLRRIRRCSGRRRSRSCCGHRCRSDGNGDARVGDVGLAKLITSDERKGSKDERAKNGASGPAGVRMPRRYSIQ